ncbi:DUF5955 family protein [Streptomyces sp. PT12]|uniref:DUF5955 family protein n=1 Tax=Streptomyces sp. PT12 TaxID=1510197 RepID=UPI00215D411D|nr:DUF5955 family protein [Streptomyces sp. PT12]
MAAGEAETAHIVRSVPPIGSDPRLLALRTALDRLRGDLRGYPARLADREIAERELMALEATLADGVPDTGALGESLLLIAAAIGSVSALAPGVHQLRKAVELFGVPHHRLPCGWPGGH